MEEKPDSEVDDVDRERLVKEIELIRKTLGGASNRAPSDHGDFVTDSFEDRSTVKDSDDDSEDELAIIKSPEYRPSTIEAFGTQKLTPARIVLSESDDEVLETTGNSRAHSPAALSDSDFSSDERISYKISAIVPLNNETDDVELFLRPVTKKSGTIRENIQVSSDNQASQSPRPSDSRHEENSSDDYTLAELQPLNNNQQFSHDFQSSSLACPQASYASGANTESSVLATETGETLPDHDEEEVLLSGKEDDDELNEQQRCLKLNKKYQAIIEAELRKIERLILENRKQQLGLSQVSSSMSKAKAMEYKTLAAYTNSYFRKARKERPDDNEDTKLRKSLAQPHPYEKPPRPWTKGEKILLSDAVQSEVLQFKLTPLLQRVETIVPRRKKTKEEEKELEVLRKEIDRIKSLPLPVLVENFTENIDFADISNKMLPSRTPHQCQVFWYNELHPHLNKEKWTKEEDKSLLKLAEMNSDGGNWNEIACELKSNRSPAQCLQRYQKCLNKNFLKSKWTPEEDKKLIEGVKMCGLGMWEKVASFLEGRTGCQCMHRYVKSIDPEIKRGTWDKEEDDLVRKGVQKYGFNWIKFKNLLPHRTDSQTRERWQDVLDPRLRKTRWTKEEDARLLKVVEEQGFGLKNWACVAKHMPGRTDNRCRRRWFKIMKDDPRAIEHLSKQKIQKAKLVNNFSRRRTAAKPEIGPEDFDLSELSDTENDASTSQAPENGRAVDDGAIVAGGVTTNARESSPPRSPERNLRTRKSPRSLETSGELRRMQTRTSRSPKQSFADEPRTKIGEKYILDIPVPALATIPSESSPSQTNKPRRGRPRKKLTAPSPTVVSQASALPNAMPMSYLTQFSVFLQAFHVDVSGVLKKVNSPGRPTTSHPSSSTTSSGTLEPRSTAASSENNSGVSNGTACITTTDTPTRASSFIIQGEINKQAPSSVTEKGGTAAGQGNVPAIPRTRQMISKSGEVGIRTTDTAGTNSTRKQDSYGDNARESIHASRTEASGTISNGNTLDSSSEVPGNAERTDQEQRGEGVEIAKIGERPSKRKQDENRSMIQRKRQRKTSEGRGMMEGRDGEFSTLENNEETSAGSIDRVETSPSRYPKRSNRGHQKVEDRSVVGSTANKAGDDCVSERVSADMDKSISPGSVSSRCAENNPQLQIERISSNNIANTAHGVRVPAIPPLPPSAVSLNAFKKLLTLRKELQSQASRLQGGHNNQAIDQTAGRSDHQNAQPSNQNTSTTTPVQNPVGDRLLFVSNTKQASHEPFTESIPYQQLSNRFKSLFMWPGFLSIVNPSLVKPISESSQKNEIKKTPKRKRMRRKRDAR